MTPCCRNSNKNLEGMIRPYLGSGQSGAGEGLGLREGDILLEPYPQSLTHGGKFTSRLFLLFLLSSSREMYRN